MHNSLLIIKNRLNQYLKNTIGAGEDVAVLSSLTDNGDFSGSGCKVVLTLVNVQREPFAGKTQRTHSTENNTIIAKHAPLHLNLYLLVTSNCGESNYEESLKYLSLTMRFFQSNSLFNHHSAPELEKHVEKLTLEIVDMDFHELSQLWSIVGANYMPSVVYKIRMISIGADTIASESKRVSSTTVGVNQ